jgi:hypothetical protein
MLDSPPIVSRSSQKICAYDALPLRQMTAQPLWRAAQNHLHRTCNYIPTLQHRRHAMVSQRERARLLEAYKHEPVSPVAVIFKASACLLLIVGLAMSGAAIDLSGHDASHAQAPSHENAWDRSQPRL